MNTTSPRRSTLLGLMSALLLAGCTSQPQVGSAAIEGKTPDGQVTLQMTQAAYMGSGTTGSGTLTFRGRQYAFDISGLGVGGVGISQIEAEGEVYNLRSAAAFGGSYAQARHGFAIGTVSGGALWMQNSDGVILHLRAKRTGLMLSLGGDVMVIKLH